MLAAWFGGRRVGERGEHCYWFEPTEAGRFRQHRRLSEEDAARWRSLPAWYREKLDAFTQPPLLK